jgi:hypothetical protein
MTKVVVAGILAIAMPIVASRLGVVAESEARRPALPVTITPLADSSFARLVARISEPGGYFDSDNLISNESSYLHVLGAMRHIGVSGGAYVGVGPDQNFSYIALVRPRIAFIIDIRRDNLLEHLMYKALFDLSRSRIDFLCLLFGRPVPASLAGWETKSAQEILEYLDHAPEDRNSAEQARSAVREKVQTFGIPLSPADIETIVRIQSAFFEGGPDLRFSSLGRAPRPYYPTYRQLVLEKDLAGKQASFLADEESFQVVRSLERQNLIVPVVGDLAGDKALREIGKVMAERGDKLSAFYASNVEFYLMRDGSFDRFARTLTGLPFDNRSVLIRSYFGGYYGGAHPHAVPGYFSTQLLQRVESFADQVRRGGYNTYSDVVTKSLVDLR